VTLTYALTLTASGDGVLGNTVWSPRDPDVPDPPAPTCENAVDGIDPITHEPCAVVSVDRPIAQLVSKTADDDDATRQGDTVTYTIVVRNVGAADFTAGNPVRVRDDLSGVLDDAVPFVLATASDGGAGGRFSYARPQLVWSGPLAMGASVTLTYTVTLAQGGDSLVHNVTWIPVDPGSSAVPDCPLPMRGARAVSPNCAAYEFPLPATAVDKEVEAPKPVLVGSLVDYTITVTNVGKAPYTAPRLAEMSDSLADVLTHAVMVGSPAASSGTLTYAAPRLSWTGALAVGGTATITYRLKITSGGTGSIPNVAWVPNTPGAPPPACQGPFGPNHTDPVTHEVCSTAGVDFGARPVRPGKLPFTGVQGVILLAVLSVTLFAVGTLLRRRRARRA
jgi:uncharacterized repeat protein (TIGR01451 family)